MKNKNFYIRNFDAERDYETVERWFVERGKEFLPAQVLPQLGVVACEEMDGEPLCAGWLLMDNSSPLAQIEWLGAAFDLPLWKVKSGLLAVVDFLTLAAKDMGYIIIRAVTYPAIAKVAEQNGWEILCSDLVSIGKTNGKGAN